jgi:hypothetical protein
MIINAVLSFLSELWPEKQMSYYRFSDAQLATIYERTSTVLKILRRRWSERLCEEDEIEIICKLDQLRRFLERKALAARLNFEPEAETELLNFSEQVAAAAESCCLASRVEENYPKVSDI